MSSSRSKIDFPDDPDDLRALLADLAKDEQPGEAAANSEPVAAAASGEKPRRQKARKTPKKETPLVGVNGDTPAAPPAPSPSKPLPKTDDRVSVLTPATSPQEEIGDSGSSDDLIKKLEGVVDRTVAEFDTVGNEILGNYRQNRNEIKGLIDNLTTIVGDFKTVIPRGGATIIESLVQAYDVRANTDLTAVKLLDSKSKLLAALKSQVQILIDNRNQGGNLNAMLAGDSGLTEFDEDNP